MIIYPDQYTIHISSHIIPYHPIPINHIKAILSHEWHPPKKTLGIRIMDDELDRAAKKHRLQQRHGALRVADKRKRENGGASPVFNERSPGENFRIHTKTLCVVFMI